MLTVVDGIDESQRLHKQLRDNLVQSASSDPETIEFGYQGGNRRASAVWFKENSWWYGNYSAKHHHWNAFGLGNALLHRGQRNIVVEINAPEFGINRKVQGAFARDDEDRYCLVHRGRLGGGREGVGSSFLDWYPGEGKREMKDGDRTTEVILIGWINLETLSAAVRAFVGLAKAYKQARDVRPTRKEVDLVVDALYRPRYRPEYSGISTYTRPEREIEAEWRHGRVVGALREELSRLGYDAHNDTNRDLYLVDGPELVVLFEVKTGVTLQTLYTAVGQLAWHSTPGCRRIGVFPRDISDAAKIRLGELDVKCVYYDWNDGSPTFEDVERALNAPLRLRTAH